MKPGMTLSNEPGYYEDGKYGIRIENIVLVREVKTPNNFGDKGYLGFEHVTMYVYFSTSHFTSGIVLILYRLH
jgi:Xaa-Pro aminopeptidase